METALPRRSRNDSTNCQNFKSPRKKWASVTGRHGSTLPYRPATSIGFQCHGSPIQVGKLGYDCSSYGPTFGGGHDFYTDLRTSAYANLGYSYACRVGSFDSSECRDDFAEGFDCALVEIEV